MSRPLFDHPLRLPVICAPMFILSRPELVIAQCLAGLAGSFPALNARPQEMLDGWLTEIGTALEAARAADPSRRIAPFAVNQIVHPTNGRLEQDMESCIRHRVPLIITSLHAPGAIVPKVHAYGGKVLHDVISVRHAEKALEAGVDGLILVCAGAGGHAGTLSPFALLGEIRRFYDGPVALAGAISRGEDILAARAMGADFAYMGTRFIASREAAASDEYKACILASHAGDIVYTPYFTGIPGNYLKASVRAAGLDPDALPAPEAGGLSLTKKDAKAWRDIWGAGQGVGNIHDAPPVATIVDRLEQEYRAAREKLSAGC
ncbi:NAD(P)H-dependent flavin oxidoreductase [Uliginosibacterium paludis]|uniref:Nitronate monooxygenase family protein n=1 Tax=Uliginosibacterium paludis TaxID=1615952 RepID=A0ABV2CT04_9RHOO